MGPGHLYFRSVSEVRNSADPAQCREPVRSEGPELQDHCPLCKLLTEA